MALKQICTTENSYKWEKMGKFIPKIKDMIIQN